MSVSTATPSTAPLREDGLTARAAIVPAAAALAVFSAFVVLCLLEIGGRDLDTGVERALGCAALLAGAALAAARAVRVRADRLAWAAIAVALIAYFAGFAAWFFVVDLPAQEWVAHVLWLASYAIASAGLALLIGARIRAFRSSALMDGVIVGVSAAAVVLWLFLPPLAGGAGTSIDVVYPLAALVLVGMVVGSLAFVGWWPGMAWAVLTGGLVLLLAGELVYVHDVDAGVVMGPVAVTSNLLWVGGVLAVGLAAWLPVRPAHGRGPQWLRTHTDLVPTLFTVAAVAVLVLEEFADRPVVVSLAAVAVLAAIARAVLTFREIRRLLDANRTARTDELTGLANRRGVFAELDRALTTAGRMGAAVAVVLLDVERFRELNTTLGPAAGDRLLSEIARRLRPLSGREVTVGRIGADDFALVVAPTRPAGDAAIAVAEQARGALAEPFLIEHLKLHIDVRVGVAVCHPDDTTAEALVQRATVAVTHAKRRRSDVEVYNGELDRHALDELELLEDLRGAADAGQLVLHFQPQANPRTGAVESAEALLRWQHPTRGLLGPGAFLAHAERAGIMGPVTLRIIEDAVAEAKRWHAAGHSDLAVAVNLAGANVIDVSLPDAVAAILARHDVAASILKLEITEETVLVDPDRTVQVLRGLRRLGVGLALDDFGTGYSSLAQLKFLPVDELKIDRRFVLTLDEADEAIIRSTIALGHSLGMTVVAEGVETPDAWRTLADIGCRLVQGFFLAKPMPADVFVRWLAEREPFGSDIVAELRQAT